MPCKSIIPKPQHTIFFSQCFVHSCVSQLFDFLLIPTTESCYSIKTTELKSIGTKPSKASGILTRAQGQMYTSMAVEDVARRFKQTISKRGNLEILGGLTQASNDGTTHTVNIEEQMGFASWINKHLGHDKDLNVLLPIDEKGERLYEIVNDGIVLCKLINHSSPKTIDERAINITNLTLYRKHENLTLALNSAQAIGCNIVNIDGNDLLSGKPHLVLGLLWQIIRIGLFNQIKPEYCPGMVQLLEEGSHIDDLLKLPSETILIRWVNYHLIQGRRNRVLTNIHIDLRDSEIYTYLLYQIAPKDAGVTIEALLESDLIQRAEVMLKQAEKLGCRQFISAKDVTNGIERLNLAFIANLFNTHSGLETIPVNGAQSYVEREETREEKTYINWMNSLGVTPYVNCLYSQLTDGLVILQLFDIIQPGLVKKYRVNYEFSKQRKFFEILENCNYAVELGKSLNFSLVGIDGKNISEGNPTFTLALMWQLMRNYTLSILTRLKNDTDMTLPITETEVLQWVNQKLTEGKKLSSIKSFHDHNLQDATIILDLIDSIVTGSIDYSFVKASGKPEDNLENANYAVSMARRIGARIYVLPEDISEVKPKMIMTIFVCLMVLSEELDMCC